MTLIWLRVALICYAAGLLYALVALTRTSEILSKVALQAAYLGMVLHFVSLTEAVVETGQLTLASVHNSESLLAFLIMVVFMLVYLIYKTTSPGIVVFPIVFLLTFVAAAMVLLAAASAFVGLWSRWQTTRMTKRMQRYGSRLPQEVLL